MLWVYANVLKKQCVLQPSLGEYFYGLIHKEIQHTYDDRPRPTSSLMLYFGSQ